MTATLYTCTVVSTGQNQRPPQAPAPKAAHRPPVTLRELQEYAADLEDVIEDMSEDGLAAVRVVMELTATLRDVRSEITARRAARRI